MPKPVRGRTLNPNARTAVAVMAVVGVLLAVASVMATGGGGPNFGFDPPGDFRSAADGLCLAQAKAAAQVQMDRGQARTASGAAADQRAIAGSNAGFDDDFSALEPPISLAAPYAAYLESRSQVGGSLQSYAGALGNGGPDAILAARRDLDASRQRQWDAGAALGLQNCSGSLTASSQKQVEDVVREIDTSSNPAKVCRGMVFDSYVQSAFGGFAACKKFQKKSSNTARSIDVEGVSGVDGVSATVDFRDVAGPFDGRPLRASLFYSKGRWLLWNVIELTD
jgi:hypothetical protein